MAEPKVFSKNINTLLDEKSKGISTAEKKFMAGWDGIEKHIFKRVKDYSLKLGTTGGVLDFDPSNVEQVNGLSKVILDAIDSSDYPEKVKEYLRDFDQIKKNNIDVHKSVNNLSGPELEKLINPVQKQMVDQTVTGLTGSGIDTEFIQPMKEGIMKNIVSGATITELESFIDQFIISNPARLGRLTNYSQQIARDTLNQYDGQINSRIAAEFGLNAGRYVGSLIDDSRPQCVRWVGKGVILFEDLETEINWANNNGSGMIPGTNPANFATYRGGYNCRHSFIPFKLTKSQREELGLDEPDPKPLVEVPKKDEIDLETPQAQKDLNFTFGQSSKTPENLKTLGIPDQVFELSDNGQNIDKKNTRASYDPFKKIVNLDLSGARSTASPKYAQRVVVHEYAHRTHINEGWIKMPGIGKQTMVDTVDDEHRRWFMESVDIFNSKNTPNKKNGLKVSDIAARFDYLKLVQKYDGKIPGANRADIGEFVGAYADTIEALSSGKYGFGHGKKYFTMYGGAYRPMEWFAHAAENYWLGNPVFQSEFPELYEQMLVYYKTMVVDKKLSKFKK